MDAFRDSLLEEIKGIQANGFVHELIETRRVPATDDSDITYPNLVTGVQKSKLLESAVLFVDLRNSTSISLNNSQVKLAALYSAYVRSMTRCAHYFNGHVRNIIGDRVMVVFDRDNCFRDAIQTAMLMNSVANEVLDREVQDISIKAGIGIDFGKMLVTKTGIIKQGAENTSNRSLVWLGKPANVASKITDMANKPNKPISTTVQEGFYYPNINEWTWSEVELEEFVDHLGAELGKITHCNDYFYAFFKSMKRYPNNPPILMTRYFHDGLKREHPDLKCVKEKYWTERDVKVAGYDGKIMGGSGHYPSVSDY